MSDLATLLDPVSKLVPTLDLTASDAAERTLAEAFPPEGEAVTAITRAAFAALDDGGICDRGEPPVRFSRVRKPEADPGGCSVDAVLMDDAKGPAHTHDRGEVCLCLPLEGHADATFEDRKATWMVLPPGSRHEPTVSGGTMLILYWWPEGAVTWG